MKVKSLAPFVVVSWVVAVTLLDVIVAGPQPCPAIPGQPKCVCKSESGVIDLTPLTYSNASAPR